MRIRAVRNRPSHDAAILVNPRADAILEHLATVAALRRTAQAEPALTAGVHAVKRYQARRFERTYADLLAGTSTRRACRFFLDELYGDKDFSMRDAQFARVVPALVRLFPDELVATVQALAGLHALSEDLDLDMARHLGAGVDIDAQAYRRVWCATGRADDRERQVGLIHQIGSALAVYTRKPVLRTSLKLMRAPAAAAGLSSLQAFLEEGFNSFGALPDARSFLSTIAARERALIARLFDTGDGPATGDASAVGAPDPDHDASNGDAPQRNVAIAQGPDDPLAQLP